ncbi:MAG: zinc ribbon domain-containing protein [Candidatus Omnitrophica bacterium]|nr:zinc ribbon domain-containing protein [Candidatus Omnitrophota bacterium]
MGDYLQNMTKELTDYICTNCQHRFEAAAREGLECPKCFWTSTVKELDEVDFFQQTNDQDASQPVKKINSGFRFPRVNLLWVLIVLILSASVYGLSVYGKPLLKALLKKTQAQPSRKKAVEIKSPSPEKIKSESNRLVTDEKQPMDPLTPVERENLNRRILTADLTPELSISDQQVLEHNVQVKTGLIEKLPSALWSMEQFEQLIAEQERFYKIQLPRSYKKKLSQLFETEYLPSEQAFEAQDLVRARDFWIASLAFPVYGEDLQKHRGVVLTMLRPFILDTLSKIGAVNQILTEREIRHKEAKIKETYAAMNALIKARDWKAAYQSIEDQMKMISELSLEASRPISPPAYPQQIRFVDAGIQQTLGDLMAPQRPALMDVESLKQDLTAKRYVLEALIPEKAEVLLSFYHQAVDAIQKEQWDQAMDLLSRVRAPAVLKGDAELKIRLIQKIKMAGSQARLDSVPDTR